MLQRSLITIITSFLFGVVATTASATTKPQKQKSAAIKSTPQLDYMLVEVNGERRVVHAGEQLMVVRGDRVKITEAVLTERSIRPGLVNVVGFHQVTDDGRMDDRNKEIDTARALSKKSSLQGLGTSYRIAISSLGKPHGEVILNLIEPKLSHAVISVNGKTKVWRDGELVSVKGSDKVKVEKVVTNIGDEDNGVEFQIIPVAMADAEKLVNMKFYEIRFSRDKKVFARIPMQVEGL